MGEDRQPEHTRVIRGKAVLVNKGVPSSKKKKEASQHARPPKPVFDDETLGVYGVEEDGVHIVDLVEYGMDVSFIADDDGGGVAFNAASYPVAAACEASVLNPEMENATEERLSRLARGVGLGGVEVFGNVRQWIKVYDGEGYPLGQDGYIPSEVVDKLVEFQKLLEEAE